MSLTRSVIMVSPQEIETDNYIASHSWCRYGGDCTWGTIEELDLADRGYTSLYRTGGKDSSHLIIARVDGMPPTRAADGCPEGNDWFPYCSGVTVGILAHKGAIPHWFGSDLTVDTDDGGYTLYDFLHPVYIGGSFAYYLFKDNSLDGVYNPGAFFTIRGRSEEETDYTVYKVQDSYSIDGYTLHSDVVSGTTSITLNAQWEYTASGVGFYRDTSWMQEGGFLIIGPNGNDESFMCQIKDITSASGLTVTEILYDFSAGDNVYYWFSDIAPNYTFPILSGNAADSDGGFEGGPKETDLVISSKGSMSTSTSVESFIPIPWAVPMPYSIRNVPSTSIWLRLDDPSIPFNTNTLVFMVNGEDVTSDVQITLITGGLELFYNPPANFSMSSRVYVNVSISCSPSIYRYIAQATPSESEFITLSGGSITSFQPGGLLRIGPNPADEWETNELLYISGDNEIRLANQTQYEYTAGDLVLYTYDDYPIELSYYFDIVEDFKPPAFEIISPSDGQSQVDRYGTIIFDIKDEGLGIDISTLSFTVDNMIVLPDIYKYSDNWYRVVYTPNNPYYYNSTVNCFATVIDLSSKKNRAFITWSFDTEEGEYPIVINADPYCCAYPVHHKSHIGVDVYGRSAGINLKSLVFTWDQKQYEVLTYPKIYRDK